MSASVSVAVCLCMYAQTSLPPLYPRFLIVLRVFLVSPCLSLSLSKKIPYPSIDFPNMTTVENKSLIVHMRLQRVLWSEIIPLFLSD